MMKSISCQLGIFDFGVVLKTRRDTKNEVEPISTLRDLRRQWVKILESMAFP